MKLHNIPIFLKFNNVHDGRLFKHLTLNYQIRFVLLGAKDFVSQTILSLLLLVNCVHSFCCNYGTIGLVITFLSIFLL